MIKIDVISGFLGAGKTTLIKKLFEDAFNKEKIVLIENEFGEIGIDGSFLKESGVNIKEINSGCICCSLVGDFATSLKEVIDRFSPERIIIEPSGVGKLSDIVTAIMKADYELQINVLATVVDGPKAKIYMKNFGEFFNNQIEAANTIVVSKTDKMSEDKVDELLGLLKVKNDHANIITTPISLLDGQKLLSILEQQISLKDKLVAEMMAISEEDEDDDCCCCGEHHHHHHEHEHEHDKDDDHECCCHHHEHDEDDDHECCCHHHEHEHEHDEDDDHECCCHHHEHEHEHDEDDDHECCCHHHEHEHEHDKDDDHECCCHHHEHEHEHHHHHHHADEVFTSWGKETTISKSKEQLEEFLDTLAEDTSLGIVVRAKGIIKASDNDNWYYFDFVSGDYEIRLGNPDYIGKVVVIGSKIDEERIEDLFFNK